MHLRNAKATRTGLTVLPVPAEPTRPEGYLYLPFRAVGKAHYSDHLIKFGYFSILTRVKALIVVVVAERGVHPGMIGVYFPFNHWCAEDPPPSLTLK